MTCVDHGFGPLLTPMHADLSGNKKKKKKERERRSGRGGIEHTSIRRNIRNKKKSQRKKQPAQREGNSVGLVATASSLRMQIGAELQDDGRRLLSKAAGRSQLSSCCSSAISIADGAFCGRHFQQTQGPQHLHLLLHHATLPPAAAEAAAATLLHD